MNEVKELVEELRNKKSRDNRELLDRSANMIEELAKELCEKSGCHHKCNDTTDCVVEDEAKEVIANSATTKEKQIEEMARTIYNGCSYETLYTDDYKEYARQMRENCVKDHNGNIICSAELWEQIASIIESTADVVPKSEVDRLTVELEAMRTSANSYKMHYESTKNKVEELEGELVVWKQNRFNIFQSIELYDKTRAKVAREIFEEIEEVLNNIGYFDEIDFKALKKKYAKSEGNI
jgi:hypothetical protein